MGAARRRRIFDSLARAYNQKTEGNLESPLDFKDNVKSISRIFCRTECLQNKKCKVP